MKLLKFILLIVLASLCTSGFSQTDKKESTLSGVYLSYKDFQNDKLTYEIDCSKDKFIIRLHDFFSKAYIDVIRDGKKHTLQKNEVYGYRACDNNMFRFYNNREYQLVESKNINIYFHEEHIAVGASYRIEKTTFFSVKPDGEIKPLTLGNLKSAYPDNHKFHEMLDEGFKDKTDISEYDTSNKMFKVNLIYEKSLKD
jgi:hypothetical protein